MNQSHSSTSTVQHVLLYLTQGAAETVTCYSKTRKQEAVLEQEATYASHFPVAEATTRGLHLTEMD